MITPPDLWPNFCVLHCGHSVLNLAPSLRLQMFWELQQLQAARVRQFLWSSTRQEVPFPVARTIVASLPRTRS